MKNIEKVTNKINFFEGNNPFDLLKKFGSPLYVYNERILRKSCQEMKNLVNYKNFSVNYSTKANSNLELLKIVKSENLDVDAMSPGEIFIELKAGFLPEQIFYISNNVSDEEMKYAIDKNILISVDSISQLIRYGKLNFGGNVAIRFNGGIGAGHHEKVITAGKNTKFGVNIEHIIDVKKVLKQYNLNLIGINQHIGSLFMEEDKYIDGVNEILKIAKNFNSLEFIDLGGGFGIPYNKIEDINNRLNIKTLGEKLDKIFDNFSKEYGKEIKFKIEPGRYIAAECGVLLGTVNSIKQNYDTKYVGTDIGFNVLARPFMYNSHHDIEVFKNCTNTEEEIFENVTIVGNICESGDILAKNRMLPKIEEDDVLAILDTGAYGYSMASNYNNRLRPAEVFIMQDGTTKLVRKKDSLEDLMKNFI